jgi:hypothetical protein
VYEVARVMADRSCAATFAGTVKEMLGTCVSGGWGSSTLYLPGSVGLSMLGFGVGQLLLSFDVVLEVVGVSKFAAAANLMLPVQQ